MILFWVMHRLLHKHCSVAILIYLKSKYSSIADHWYPEDIKKRARVDQYMAWQTNTVRRFSSSVFLDKARNSTHHSFQRITFNYKWNWIRLTIHVGPWIWKTGLDPMLLSMSRNTTKCSFFSANCWSSPKFFLCVLGTKGANWFN